MSDRAGLSAFIGLTPYPDAARMRRFWIEVDADGAPFTWTGDAVSEQAAFRCAAHDLAVKFPNVNTASVRLTACIEVAA